MKKRTCSYPGCGKLTDMTERYCEEHKTRLPKTDPPARRAPVFGTAVRSNAGLYNTARWRHLRAQVLKVSGCCFRCGAVAALEVHHLIPPEGCEELFFDPQNLAAVCRGCHRILTAREIQGRRAKPK